MSYKTLIIIDNSSELASYNQDTIKATIKYYLNHVDSGDKVAIAVTGETAEYLTDYEDSLSTQQKAIDSLEFKDINAPGADVLMEVLLNWKESDLANRDILYVSCREISTNSEYSEEELFFEVNNKQYPIYTLSCSQNENDRAVKSMNSLSRISGGESVNTNDAKKDAEVDKQLAELLGKAMREHREREKEQFLANESEYDAGGKLEVESNDDENKEILEEVQLDTNYVSGDDILDEAENGQIENVVYEMPDTGTDYSQIILPAVIIIATLIAIAVSVVIRNRKNKKEEDMFRSRNSSKNRSNDTPSRLPFEGDLGGETVCLFDSYSDDEGGTRLLYQAKDGVEITLEDRSNPTKFFRACVSDAVVIGRNEKLCDIAISYDDSVSSKHCELYLREGDVYCRDLGSSNGTMVNQQKVYQEIRIESGDILRIGRLSFFVQVLGDSYE